MQTRGATGPSLPGRSQFARKFPEPGQSVSYATGLLVPEQMASRGNDDYLCRRQQPRSLLPLADRHRALLAQQEDGRHADAAERASELMRQRSAFARRPADAPVSHDAGEASHTNDLVRDRGSET
jgi:hypothetical protein